MLKLMKSKNVFLATLAIVLAVGSAFASLTTTQRVWVRAIASQGAEYTCFDTGVNCDDSGVNICKVSVVTTSGTRLATSSANPKTYKSGCITVLFNTTDATQVANPGSQPTPFDLE